MNKITNILMAGVGGQGTLLASEILCEVLMQAGFEVKKSEIHGMSQRGGSVTSHVRFGPKVFSPLIPEGEVDILFGFELLETYRCLPELRKDGKVIANELKILPSSVAMGKESYPEGIPAKIKAVVPGAQIVNGLEIAREAGNFKTANVALLGVLSQTMDIPEKLWLDALKNQVPEKFLQENIKAFQLGRNR